MEARMPMAEGSRGILQGPYLGEVLGAQGPPVKKAKGRGMCVGWSPAAHSPLTCHSCVLDS